MISEAAIEELKLRNPCDQVAAQWVTLRRGGKLGSIGPCPLHSPRPDARDSTSFECNAVSWVCASCQDGGDVIKLTALRNGLDQQRDFLRVVELLGGSAEPDADRAAVLERERQDRQAASERDNNLYRERERGTVFEIWKRGVAFPGTAVERYLRLRGLEVLPDDLKLRCIDDMPYYASGARDACVVHRGPCMLAPIVDAAGKFRALHMTWLDLDRPNGKAQIRDPETGDALPTKKVRGSKAGNVIRLAEPIAAAGEVARFTLYIGEGIETVLSVWYALRRAGRDLARTAFWSAVDLGNLGGKAAASLPHPELKDARGRVRHVPGFSPDLDAPTIAIADDVDKIVLLGDGDSDRFSTQCTLARAAARWERAGRVIRCAWAPDGFDFNDELRAA